MTKQYIGLVEAIANFTGPVFVLQYELLRSNLAGQLEPLAKFLNVTVTTDDIACTAQLQEGHYHRKTDSNKRKEMFNQVYNYEKLDQFASIGQTSQAILKTRFPNLAFDFDSYMPI